MLMTPGGFKTSTKGHKKISDDPHLTVFERLTQRLSSYARQLQPKEHKQKGLCMHESLGSTPVTQLKLFCTVIERRAQYCHLPKDAPVRATSQVYSGAFQADDDAPATIYNHGTDLNERALMNAIRRLGYSRPKQC